MLDLQVRENIPAVVMGDGRRLRQVLHNLVANAVKFTEEGRITVRAQPSNDGEGVIISVRDTGPGIAPEARERIFQPFAQEDASITRRYGGTGLGLSISRQICEAMDGSLALVSRTGNGATFYMELPLQAAAPGAAAPTGARETGPPNLADRQILVADDNETNRLILRRFLKPTGASLSMAANGVEAVEQASETRFDAILMDVQMPRMDGVAATVAIREEEGARALAPVVIIGVTANVLAHQAAEYREEGMTEVLAKPVSKRALFEMLYALAGDAAAA